MYGTHVIHVWYLGIYTYNSYICNTLCTIPVIYIVHTCNTDLYPTFLLHSVGKIMVLHLLTYFCVWIMVLVYDFNCLLDSLSLVYYNECLDFVT